MSKIAENLLELSGKIESDLKVKDGNITSDENSFIKNLPDGLTEESVRGLEEYRNVYIPAAHLAIGKAAIKAMEAASDLDKVTGEVSVGITDTYKLSMERSATIPIASGGSREVFGVATGKLDVVAIHAKGDMLRVKNLLRETAENLLGGKEEKTGT